MQFAKWIYKIWIKLKNRASDAYWTGMLQFLDIASSHLNSDGAMKWPFKRQVNKELHTLDVLEANIMGYGFHPIYTTWIWRGEYDVNLTLLVQPFSSST